VLINGERLKIIKKHTYCKICYGKMGTWLIHRPDNLHTDNEEYTVYAKLMAITAVENREQLR
jgi:hypothetical protein